MRRRTVARWRSSASCFSRSRRRFSIVGDRRFLFLDHAVEEVDDALRIEQRIEAVVGAQLAAACGTRAARRRACSRTGRRRPACGAPARPRPRCRAAPPDRAAGAGSRSRAGTRRARTPCARGRRRRAPRGCAGSGPVGPAAMQRAGQRRDQARSAIQLLPARSFTTCLRRCPARTRTCSLAKASPLSAEISISLLESSSAKNGMSISSPGRAAVVAPSRVGSRTSMRVDAPAGSVVTTRCAGRHLSRRAMIESAGSGCSGPTSTRSRKQQFEGLRNSM